MKHPVQTEAGFIGSFQNGVGWYVYPTQRFKTISLQAFWINDLMPKTAAEGALLPHLLKRGTMRWRDSMAIEKQLESLYGATFRADVGKIADKQLISVSLEIVHGQHLPGSPDTLQDGLAFLEEILNHPLTPAPHEFDPQYVEQEKELLRRQIRGLINDKNQYAMHRLLETMADGRTFGLRKLGQIEDLDAINPGGLYQYYQNVRDQSPFVLLVVGDVDPETIESYVTQGWAQARRPFGAIEPYTPRHHDHEVIEKQPVSQGKVNWGYATGHTLTSPSYPALMMYAGVLGGFPHSKLFVNVREKASLAYYAYARIDAALSLMVIGAGIEFEDYHDTKRIVAEQLEAMVRGEISDQELQYTLEAFRNDILSEEDAPSQLIGRQMEKILLGGGLTGNQLIHALSDVSVSDIQAVAEGIQLDTTFFLTTDGSGRDSDG